MRLPDLNARRNQVGVLLLVLLSLIATRMTMAQYGMTGELFDATLIGIYLIFVVLIILAAIYMWRSRDVVRPPGR